MRPLITIVNDAGTYSNPKGAHDALKDKKCARAKKKELFSKKRKTPGTYSPK
jgi:hypothetical protein